MDKMTNARALTFVLDTYADTLPTAVKDKLDSMLVQVNKRSSAERKPTAVQKENEGLKSAILDYMIENGGKYTISELIKVVPELDGLTVNKVSGVVRSMKDNDKSVVRIEDKRKAYFTLAPSEDEE